MARRRSYKITRGTPRSKKGYVIGNDNILAKRDCVLNLLVYYIELVKYVFDKNGSILHIT
jgi:hypothetical protein